MTVVLGLRLGLAYSQDEIRDLPEKKVRDYEVLLLPARKRWIFDPSFLGADDHLNTLRPSWISSDLTPGRWRAWIVATSGSGGGGVTLPIEISDVTGLQTELDDLQTQIDDAAILPIAEADVTGLVLDLFNLEAEDISLQAQIDALSLGAVDLTAIYNALAGAVANERFQRIAGDIPDEAEHILASQIFGG